MAKSVCIAVGHWNIEQINTPEQQSHLRSWRSTSVLKSSTGASGERDYFWQKVMPLMRDKLIAAGIEVHIADAIYRDEIYSKEYDLWVALHYDGGGTDERCMITAPRRDQVPAYLNAGAHDLADRFADIWRRSYPEKVGVTLRQDRVTAGMLDYYAFDYVGFDTPAVIIEQFNHTSPRGEQLKQDPELVAQANVDAILEFLGVVTQPAPQNIGDTKIDFDDAEGQRRTVKFYVSEWWNRYDQVKRLTGDVETATNLANAYLKQIDELKKGDSTALKQAQAEIAQLTSKVEDKSKTIGTLNTQLTTARADLTAKDNIITQKDQKIQELIASNNSVTTVGDVLKLLWQTVRGVKLVKEEQ